MKRSDIIITQASISGVLLLASPPAHDKRSKIDHHGVNLLTNESTPRDQGFAL